MGRLLIPAVVMVMLLSSHVAVGQFVFGQDASPMVHVLSVVFIASVCGLIDRDAQVFIGRHA